MTKQLPPPKPSREGIQRGLGTMRRILREKYPSLSFSDALGREIKRAREGFAQQIHDDLRLKGQRMAAEIARRFAEEPETMEECEVCGVYAVLDLVSGDGLRFRCAGCR